jgi:hypothetical protein
MSTAQLVRQFVKAQPLGEPFTPAALLQFGTRKAIDLELARLAKSAVIMRSARGIYVRPKSNKYVGIVQPEPFKIAMVRAGGNVEVHGAEAARHFGLSTQVQVQPVYYTTGPSRRIQYGSILIRLKHISSRKLVAPGTKVGLAISALWYLGKNQVEPATFAAIRQRLSETEYMQLKAAVPQMPAWMAEGLMRFERQTHA